MLSRPDVESKRCSRERHCSSTYRTAQARASTLLISRTPPTEALQGMQPKDLPPLMTRLNSLLRFEGFSLTVLLLLQTHFLQEKKRNWNLRHWKNLDRIKVNEGARSRFALQILFICSCERQWIEYFRFSPYSNLSWSRDENKVYK